MIDSVIEVTSTGIALEVDTDIGIEPRSKWDDRLKHHVSRMLLLFVATSPFRYQHFPPLAPDLGFVTSLS